MKKGVLAIPYVYTAVGHLKLSEHHVIKNRYADCDRYVRESKCKQISL